MAEEDGKIVGFIMSQLHGPTGKATLENIFVEKEARNKGLGEKLLSECIKRLKKRGAIYICALTKTDNKTAIDFSLKHGFRKGYDFTWLELK